MKKNALILFICSSFGLSAQCTLFHLPSESFSQEINYTNVTLFDIPFVEENTADIYFKEKRLQKKVLHSVLAFTSDYSVPKPPVLNTKSAFLEVCEGNSTTLTAISDYPIEWYTNYPPEGEPVGRGNVFVTPPLNKGYYIYHAVANNQGTKSNSSEMEVVMVYPLPFISIVANSEPICSGESATFSAFGTRFYSWSTGETSHEITVQPKHTTTYEVTGINTAGCKHTISLTQVVESCQASNTFSSQEVLAESKKQSLPDKSFTSYIYPNPNNGEFHVQLSAISEFTHLEVYSAFGELVYAEKITKAETTLNLRHVNKGIYTLRILEQNLVLSQQKIVIEN